MMKAWLAGLTAVIVMAGAMTASAENKTATPAKQDKTRVEKAQTLEEMTVSGTVLKMERKKKDGTPMMVWYILKDKDGSEIALPKGKVEEFVDSSVTITGMGTTVSKRGTPKKAIKSISKIEKTAAT